MGAARPPPHPPLFTPFCLRAGPWSRFTLGIYMVDVRRGRCVVCARCLVVCGCFCVVVLCIVYVYGRWPRAARLASPRLTLIWAGSRRPAPVLACAVLPCVARSCPRGEWSRAPWRSFAGFVRPRLVLPRASMGALVIPMPAPRSRVAGHAVWGAPGKVPSAPHACPCCMPCVTHISHVPGARVPVPRLYGVSASYCVNNNAGLTHWPLRGPLSRNLHCLIS